MRKRTGLRNRQRTGRSTYSKRRKGERADSYGTWSAGKQERPDTIAGRSITYRSRPAQLI